MNVKERNREKLLEFLGDPSNDFLSRSELSLSVLGYKLPNTIYKHLTSRELDAVEAEALAERKRRSARSRAQVYDALLKKALKGDVVAIREFLDRTEGKVLAKIESTEDFNINVTRSVIDGGAMDSIERAKRIGAILDIARHRREEIQ